MVHNRGETSVSHALINAVPKERLVPQVRRLLIPGGFPSKCERIPNTLFARPHSNDHSALHGRHRAVSMCKIISCHRLEGNKPSFSRPHKERGHCKDAAPAR